MDLPSGSGTSASSPCLEQRIGILAVFLSQQQRYVGNLSSDLLQVAGIFSTATWFFRIAFGTDDDSVVEQRGRILSLPGLRRGSSTPFRTFSPGAQSVRLDQSGDILLFLLSGVPRSSRRTLDSPLLRDFLAASFRIFHPDFP